ncbi:MAG: serine hydrolase [Chloroflexi bacterium]|nr:serine hydrolase [Chloroflexota bacterium]
MRPRAGWPAAIAVVVAIALTALAGRSSFGVSAPSPGLGSPASTVATAVGLHSTQPRGEDLSPAADVPAPSADAPPSVARQLPDPRPAAAEPRGEAAIAVLDPALGAWLAAFGGRVGVRVVDLAGNVAYGFNDDRAYITASSVKVAILVAILRRLEAAHREPTTHELALMTAMIERSNNDAATALYRTIGGGAGLRAFGRAIGLDGLTPPRPDFAWYWTRITPRAMARLLELLDAGRLVNARHSALALSLMRHQIASQRWGPGDTAPDGARVSMKTGHIYGPDGLMVANASGIVTANGHRWIVSVYTMDDPTFAAGKRIVNRVCAAVAALLG